MSFITPGWELDLKTKAHMRGNAREAGITRSRELGFDKICRELQIFDIHPHDLGLISWKVPVVISESQCWAHHTVDFQTVLALVGVTWIGQTVGPQELRIHGGTMTSGRCMAAYSLARIYSPVMVSQFSSPEAGDLEGLNMEGYFNFPVVLDASYTFSIELRGRAGFSYQRDLVLFGYAAKLPGAVTV